MPGKLLEHLVGFNTENSSITLSAVSSVEFEQDEAFSAPQRDDLGLYQKFVQFDLGLGKGFGTGVPAFDTGGV